MPQDLYERRLARGRLERCRGFIEGMAALVPLVEDKNAQLMEIAAQLRAAEKGMEPPHVMTLDEIRAHVGPAVLETWLEPYDDADEDEEEEILLEECACCRGSIVLRNDDFMDGWGFGELMQHYNRRYGVRLWNTWPSDQDREEIAWEDGEDP